MSIAATVSSLAALCKIEGTSHRAGFSVAREAFLSEEHSFEVSAYPHRELISREAIPKSPRSFKR